MAVVQNFGQKDENNQQQSPPAFGGSESASGGGSAGQTQAAPQQRQGSGLFTNLNKYIQANQGAGQRTAQNVGQNLNKQFEPEKTNVFNQSQNTQKGIGEGQEALKKGSEFKTIFNQGNPSAFENVANDDKQAAEFAKFRTGQGVNVNQLQNNANQFEQANLAAQQKLGQFGQQVGSEQGRFGLLKQAYGGMGKRYGSGQQKLDQLLLQSGGDNAVGTLKNTVAGLGQSVNPEMQKLAGYKQDIGKIGTDQADLAKVLTESSGKAFGQQSDELNKQMADINAARDADRAYAANLAKSLRGEEGSADFNEEMANKLGLHMGQRTYNALNNINTDQDVYSADARNATNIGQTSSEGQINRYNALQKLMRGGYNAQDKNLVYDQNLNAKYDAANQLGKQAVNYKDYSAEVKRQEEDFNKYLESGAANMRGSGEGSQTAAAEGVNLKDYLANPEDRSKYHYKNSTDWNKDNQYFTGDQGGYAGDQYGSGPVDLNKGPGTDNLGITDPLGQMGVFDTATLHNSFYNAIGANNLMGGKGISADDYRYAEDRAHENLISNINKSLGSKGYFNELGQRGKTKKNEFQAWKPQPVQEQAQTEMVVPRFEMPRFGR